jgi:hypothetical protein
VLPISLLQIAADAVVVVIVVPVLLRQLHAVMPPQDAVQQCSMLRRRFTFLNT